MLIPYELKRRCVNAEGSARDIYNNIFLPEHEGMSFETFRRKLKLWRRQTFADNATLEAGTYGGFIAHGATVQVNGNGEITQAWIKQSVDDGTFDRLVEVIKESAEPLQFTQPHDGTGMLEIPLFDLHFPLSDHAETFNRIVNIISGKTWEQTYIIIGQDMFHNDDMRGRTSKGTPIEKADIPLAWKMARAFWWGVISTALEHSANVSLIYSKGNHDESLAWAFVQSIREAFPQLEVDDSLKQRKCISWGKIFIGITHGDYRQNSNNDMRGQFSITFPQEFANAKVREIHAGHLHHETSADVYGVMCRRLSRNGIYDNWSDDEGYIGALQRFMLFEWESDRLSAIRYV